MTSWSMHCIPYSYLKPLGKPLLREHRIQFDRTREVCLVHVAHEAWPHVNRPQQGVLEGVCIYVVLEASPLVLEAFLGSPMWASRFLLLFLPRRVSKMSDSFKPHACNLSLKGPWCYILFGGCCSGIQPPQPWFGLLGLGWGFWLRDSMQLEGFGGGAPDGRFMAFRGSAVDGLVFWGVLFLESIKIHKFKDCASFSCRRGLLVACDA